MNRLKHLILTKTVFGALALFLSSCATYDALESGEFHGPISKIEKANERKCEVDDQEVDKILLSNHVLESGSDGDLADDRFGGSFNDAFRKIMLGYAEAVENSEEGEHLRLLFYFNGGLNAQGDVEHQAAKQIPCMMNDGFYPVFFIWDTAGFNTYKEQVTRIYDGHRSSAPWRPLLAPFQVGGDVLLGIGHAPEDYVLHGRRFWRALDRKPPCYLVVRTQALEGITCDDAQHVNFVENQSETAYGKISPDSQVVIDKIRGKVDRNQQEVRRFLLYTALWPARIVSTPFAHGLGAAAWENMLRRTRTTVRRSIEYYLDRHGYYEHGELATDLWAPELKGMANNCPRDFREKHEGFRQGTGVFAKFFEMLKRHHEGKALPINQWSCHGEDISIDAVVGDGKSTSDLEMGTSPDEPCDVETARTKLTADETHDLRDEDVCIRAALKDAEITLIGHSMGTIVINELLSRFPTLPYSDIVYMAAAASVRDTRATLDQYFSQDTDKARNTRFYSLMLHPLNDTRERQYGGVVPSGSLLMWIDEMYEVPKVPNDKTFGFWPNAKSSRTFFDPSAQERMLYRIFNRPNPYPYEPANPMNHGDFNNDETCFWRPAFWGVRNTEWQKRYENTMPAQALEECRAGDLSSP